MSSLSSNFTTDALLEKEQHEESKDLDGNHQTDDDNMHINLIMTEDSIK